MDIRYIKNVFFLLLGAFAMGSCEEDLGFKEPIGTDTTVPGTVSNITVQNLSGKAKLTYNLPTNQSLLYVKAVYKLANGEEAEVKSSYYNSELTVEGFADTLEHEVKVYAVSRTKVSSEPVTVIVKPLEAPIWKVYKSIKVDNAFGGYNLSAENPDADNVAIMVMKPNAFNEFEVDNNKSVFTRVSDIQSKIRGLDTVNYEFQVFVRDKWGNSTDTSTVTVKPIYEVELEPTKFRAFQLPGDAPQVTNGARLEYAWDNRLGWPYVSFTHQVNGGPGPHMITFDTGVSAKLSRFWIRPFPELSPAQFYFLTTLKKFEVYGSENPSLSGALDESWVLLGSYEVTKPSDTPYGQDTALDRETGEKGWDFDIPLTAPKVRYIRVRCLENWAGGTAQSINEIKVYGDPR
ncbi:DUF4959 domain-containing protein [Pontibacter harenae]|uniref:DUF4959 domain-containing protein n=1 Tax=Pontibacter harenae TaxID=2894083 RepID=UPI001E539B17|nr:DUF4959 domain-containing protein [Pontibacter harenae]MCC9168186.1 DUF4959 domain-containing protein [Pontibacter harenae]